MFPLSSSTEKQLSQLFLVTGLPVSVTSYTTVSTCFVSVGLLVITPSLLICRVWLVLSCCWHYVVCMFVYISFFGVCSICVRVFVFNFLWAMLPDNKSDWLIDWLTNLHRQLRNLAKTFSSNIQQSVLHHIQVRYSPYEVTDPCYWNLYLTVSSSNVCTVEMHSKTTRTTYMNIPQGD